MSNASHFSYESSLHIFSCTLHRIDSAAPLQKTKTHTSRSLLIVILTAGFLCHNYDDVRQHCPFNNEDETAAQHRTHSAAATALSGARHQNSRNSFGQTHNNRGGHGPRATGWLRLNCLRDAKKKKGKKNHPNPSTLSKRDEISCVALVFGLGLILLPVIIRRTLKIFGFFSFPSQFLLLSEVVGFFRVASYAVQLRFRGGDTYDEGRRGCVLFIDRIYSGAYCSANQFYGLALFQVGGGWVGGLDLTGAAPEEDFLPYHTILLLIDPSIVTYSQDFAAVQVRKTPQYRSKRTSGENYETRR
ncbi:uncharacterized protein MYCFIDRAFT_209219 [Pseudocercospora fijiensis CIRAD86]|uniref:Uncharacterized protein n=1 Tax=Pseudocercospora fijiensis (strain CIRAD86) TaxID=383855 RepID=M3A0I8_PSEFD|nr:uncharacterized protein MYCFIDRAFT_209219 [Pseudocercospora fijiensis CIRAD86]EME77921.1 hypothetical protein MYCFIDRAFT_209219 [Pseudocercospora fijiensis CIRAD86]